MSAESPAGPLEDEEQDEVTLKYRKLLPNYFLAASPELSALHFTRLAQQDHTIDVAAEPTRCLRCGHFLASTRVSVARAGTRTPSTRSDNIVGTNPAPGIVISRSCDACSRKTSLSVNDAKSTSGRSKLESVRRRMRGQLAQPSVAAPVEVAPPEPILLAEVISPYSTSSKRLID